MVLPLGCRFQNHFWESDRKKRFFASVLAHRVSGGRSHNLLTSLQKAAEDTVPKILQLRRVRAVPPELRGPCRGLQDFSLDRVIKDPSESDALRFDRKE